jgi:dUTP pyrophosphatase
MRDIKSPCISLCKLANEVCIGCFRTRYEIAAWSRSSDKQKQQILNNIKNRKMVNIEFYKRLDNAQLPRYSTEGAVGADVYSAKEYTLEPGKVVLVDTGLDCRLPSGYELQVRSRSGLSLKNSIFVLNSPGTIDPDYTGPLGVILYNAGDSVFNISAGDRIAQIVVAPVCRGRFVFTQQTKETARGSGGFGSTGV